LNRYFWKKKKLWTGGYFVATVGINNEDIVKKYIQNQGELDFENLA